MGNVGFQVRNLLQQKNSAGLGGGFDSGPVQKNSKTNTSRFNGRTLLKIMYKQDQSVQENLEIRTEQLQERFRCRFHPG